MKIPVGFEGPAGWCEGWPDGRHHIHVIFAKETCFHPAVIDLRHPIRRIRIPGFSQEAVWLHLYRANI